MRCVTGLIAAPAVKEVKVVCVMALSDRLHRIACLTAVDGNFQPHKAYNSGVEIAPPLFPIIQSSGSNCKCPRHLSYTCGEHGLFIRSLS
jgi:hypothetical protein